MAYINVPYQTAAVSADSTSGGYITVASNAGFVAGAEVTMSGTGKVTQHYEITDLKGTTQIGLRLVTYPKRPQGFGRSDVSAYTLAAASKITQFPQVAQFSDKAATLPSGASWVS